MIIRVQDRNIDILVEPRGQPREEPIWRRRSFWEFLADHGLLPNILEELPLDRLRRFTYDDLRQELDYEECSIWIESFSETADELLITLPCNFQEGNYQDSIHAFHESCILEWLRNSRECPLCRSRITRDDVLRYNPEEEIGNDQ